MANSFCAAGLFRPFTVLEGTVCLRWRDSMLCFLDAFHPKAFPHNPHKELLDHVATSASHTCPWRKRERGFPNQTRGGIATSLPLRGYRDYPRGSLGITLKGTRANAQQGHNSTFLEVGSHHTYTAVNLNSNQNLAGKTPCLPPPPPSKSCLP